MESEEDLSRWEVAWASFKSFFKLKKLEDEDGLVQNFGWLYV